MASKAWAGISEQNEPTTIMGNVVAPLLGVSLTSDSTGVLETSGIRIFPVQDHRGKFGEWDFTPSRDNRGMATATHVVELTNVTLLVWKDQPLAPQMSRETQSRLNDLVNLLTLEARRYVGYVEVQVSFADGEDAHMYSFLLREYAVTLDNCLRFASAVVTEESVERCLTRWQKLPQRHPCISTAIRRLSRSWLRERDSHDAIVDQCVAIEALVGEGNSELINRISLRAAAMLATVGWVPAVETAKAVRNVYSYRSEVVHGQPGPYKKELIAIGDGSPMHAVRFATAALMALLEVYFAHESLSPAQIDEEFVFAAFDQQAPKHESRLP